VLLEIFSSVVMGGVLASTYYYQHGGGGNDATKIERIAENAGLVAKDGKKIRIHRRTRHKGYTEYVFQMPHGMAAKQFTEKLDRFQDGINIKRTVLDLEIADFKRIDWKGDVLNQIKAILQKKRKIRKEVEIEFDGMLIFRVYNEPLTEFLPFDESMLKRLRGWQVPVGMSRREFITHDFDKIAHLIIAGATDFGKSNWLKLLITTLIHRCPNDVKFSLIDLKGGLSFARFRDLNQVETVAKSPAEALEALTAVQSRMNSVIDYLEVNGFEDVKEAGMKDRHFVIIDEAADIAEDKECQAIIKDIARRGRAAGFRLVYATQYPTSETVQPQVKRNCMGRLCFVLDSAIASRVVLDEEGAEKLPLIQGRAIYKTVKCSVVQTPYIKNSFIEETIRPHINIRSQRERGMENAKGNREGTKGRTYTPIFEET
jgi:DNA segregation ATPase FtsK/SpoIIIE, S-DNA-T family